MISGHLENVKDFPFDSFGFKVKSFASRTNLKIGKIVGKYQFKLFLNVRFTLRNKLALLNNFAQ